MKIIQPRDALRFDHEAMNTTFSLRLAHPDANFARGVAHDCFTELDRLEGLLSRHIEESDISRINRLPSGETLHITEETHACLLLALDFYQRTHGLFDITLGRAIEHRKTEADGPPPPLEGSLLIHPDRAAVTCQTAGREIDLGGIGKGFALDRLGERLLEWEVGAALLAAGASTQLAIGNATWPIKITGDRHQHEIGLERAALSASGTGIQGSHIVHPDGDPGGLSHERLWLTASSATAADVWSTTLMLVGPDELRHTSEFAPEVSSLFIEEADRIATLHGS